MKNIVYPDPVSGRLSVVCLLLASVFCHLPARADPQVLGWLEAAFLEPGIRLRAKLDTGARTSSIHAIDLQTFDVNGETWIRFSIPYKAEKDRPELKILTLEKPVIRETRIKEHVGKSTTRYVVEIRFCMNGKGYLTPFTLADRSNFHYPMLLGRIFLKNRVLVDASRTFTANKSCTKFTNPDQNSQTGS